MSPVRPEGRAEDVDGPRPAPTWALIVLPIVAVVAAYVWIPRARVEAQLAQLRAENASARSTAPNAETESRENTRLMDLREQAEELHAISKAGSATTRAATGPVAHARRAADVTTALARHGLVLIEDVAAQEAGEDAARRLQGLHASEIRATGAPARALRFEGGYFDALAALREIVGPGIEALPLLVELERSTDGRTSRWRLVWI